MQSKRPADRATTPTPGRGDDPRRYPRAGAALASQPPRADDQPGTDQPGADLLESERLFRATFERAVIGIAHVSPEGRLLRVNQRLCDLLGYSREELAARTFQDLTHPADLDADLTHVRRLLAGEIEEYEMDKRYVRKDGTSVWGHLTVSLVRTADGAPDYFIGMVQDITARKRLERERGRLLARERAARLESDAARAEAEATNAQLQALQALTDTALSHLGLDDLLGELLGRVTDIMGVDHVGILLLDEDGRALTVWAARGLMAEAVGRSQIPVGQGFAGRIAASRAPLIVDDLTTLDGAHPLLREKLRSAVGVPLLVEDPVEKQGEGHQVSRLVGVITMGSAELRRFAEEDVQLLQRTADRVALAIDRARLYAAEQEARQCAEAALARAQASEAQATERAERLNTILETMADGVAVYDAEGRPLQTNRAYRELLAVEHAPAGYETLTALERVRLFAMRAAATGVPLPLESIPVTRALRGEVVTGLSADVRVRAFDGRELDINNSAAPLREPDGRIMGVVVLLHDMTERNRLARERAAARANELAAREANRRMEQFLATAAHDLRAPLTATFGYLDLAERQAERLVAAACEESPGLVPRVESVRRHLGEAGHGAERLKRLLTLLFDTSAIRADRLELRRTPHDLAALVGEWVAEQRVAAPERAIRLHTPPDGEPIPVEADADRIGQVVSNYLTNALKYSPPDRPVDVSVAVREEGGEGRAWVAVRDGGPGIPEAEQARVWELFHRAPGVETQDRARGGSLGLGLYICKAIVEAHGGAVGVASAVGAGSTFWFTLPLAGTAP